MKRLLFSYLACLLFFLAGCEKVVQKDPADAFVGTYNLIILEKLEWLGYNKTVYYDHEEIITISKIDPNTVRIRGGIHIINGTAHVDGKYITLEETWHKPIFTTGKLENGVFEFTETYTSQMESDGIIYPYTTQRLPAEAAQRRHPLRRRTNQIRERKRTPEKQHLL